MRFSLAFLACSFLSGFASIGYGESTVDFAKDVEPILEANCYSCHGAKKGLGRLRLHSADAVKEAQGVHSDLLVAGKPDESGLYGRLILPIDNKKRMPKGADPLSQEDIDTIKKWIEEGGSMEVTASAPAGEAMQDEAAAKQDVAKRPELEPATPDAIAAVEQTGALVIPLYSGSNELRVSFPSSRDQVTDETVAAIVPLAGQLVELDLSGTNITDACAESLKQFTNLDTLHLENTEISDASIAAVADMAYLKYLNLHSTKITDAALQTLATATSLEKLYLWQTAATYDAAKTLEKATPGLAVNLGWDHPGVVRERLNAELARVEAQQTKSSTAITEAEKTLAAAKADQKAAEDRSAEIKKELEALDNPPAEKTDAPAKEAAEEPTDGDTA